jgi:hypothetical protein
VPYCTDYGHLVRLCIRWGIDSGGLKSIKADKFSEWMVVILLPGIVVGFVVKRLYVCFYVLPSPRFITCRTAALVILCVCVCVCWMCVCVCVGCVCVCVHARACARYLLCGRAHSLPLFSLDSLPQLCSLNTSHTTLFASLDTCTRWSHTTLFASRDTGTRWALLHCRRKEKKLPGCSR